MKCQIPEISWHNRDPVLSVDFQPRVDKQLRLASGGTDSHVLIWYVCNDDGVFRLDLAADLTRHQRPVNCVRWSPSGEFLASGDDESFIFIWRLKPESETVNIFDHDDISDADKEVWLTFKILRGHIEDVYDLSWSQDSQFLLSGSIDNTAIVWDVQKAKSSAIIRDHKGFVQGVAWDPLNKLLATLSADRYFRIFDVQSKKNVQRNNKSLLPVSKDNQLYGKNIRLFHDDTLQTFFRRLTFSPDGTLIVVPAGVADVEDSNTKPINTTYIYTRYNLKEPAVVLPSPDHHTVAVRFSPLLYELRESQAKPLIPLPYRMIFAIATKCSVYVYDTQQTLPFALISNIHYTRLTDLAWSNDGNTILASSTDGYCSIVQFTDDELGQTYRKQTLKDILAANTQKDEPRKKKKAKKANSLKKDDKLENFPASDEKQNADQKMDIDLPTISEIVTKLPESIKEIIPVDKIIKSNDLFSPEKQVGSPAKPIEVRKYPRNIEEMDLSPPKNKDNQVSVMTTPKGSSKIPNRIEVRRHSRIPQTHSTANDNDSEDISKTLLQSPMDRKLPTVSVDSPKKKTPRRVELKTISTPKSKKKLI